MSKDIRNLRKEIKDMSKRLKKRGIDYHLIKGLSFMEAYELQEILYDVRYVLKNS